TSATHPRQPNAWRSAMPGILPTRISAHPTGNRSTSGVPFPRPVGRHENASFDGAIVIGALASRRAVPLAIRYFREDKGASPGGLGGSETEPSSTLRLEECGRERWTDAASMTWLARGPNRHAAQSFAPRRHSSSPGWSVGVATPHQHCPRTPALVATFAPV